MMLVNGLLCLISAIALLLRMKSIQDKMTNQFFQKFIWLYWAILMIVGIHRVCTSLATGNIYSILNELTPLTDFSLALLGGILAYCMPKSTEKTISR